MGCGGSCLSGESQLSGLDEELHNTAESSENPEHLRKLVQQGASLLSCKSSWQMTVLHISAYHGHAKNVLTLLNLCRQHGVIDQVLQMSKRGVYGTPLEIARCGHHSECVKILEDAMMEEGMAIPKPVKYQSKERRLRLVLTSPERLKGQGLKLLDKDMDTGETHRGFQMRLGSATEAIEVAFAADGGCVVVGGHHTLGYNLDNQESRTRIGTRCSFTNWSGADPQWPIRWQLNDDDMTISPSGHRDVVLGWGNGGGGWHGRTIPRLVSRDDLEWRFCFDRQAPLIAPQPLKLALHGCFRGQGLNLRDNLVDATHRHKAFHARLCPAEEAIEVELDEKNHLVVVAGHRTLGFGLDKYSKSSTCCKFRFSNWLGSSPQVFQINDDLTISLKDSRVQAVLGWRLEAGEDDVHLHLCNPDSTDKLQFLSRCPMNQVESRPSAV